MTLEEIRRDYGWLGNTLVSAFLGAGTMWAAAWRRMRKVEKRQAALEQIVNVLRKEHNEEVLARRRQEMRLDDVASQLSRIEGQVDIIASVVTRPTK